MDAETLRGGQGKSDASSRALFAGWQPQDWCSGRRHLRCFVGAVDGALWRDARGTWNLVFLAHEEGQAWRMILAQEYQRSLGVSAIDGSGAGGREVPAIALSGRAGYAQVRCGWWVGVSSGV